MISASAIDPRRFRIDTLVAMGDRVRHQLALRAVGTLTACKLTLGRCLLAIEETEDFKKFGCSSSTHYAVAKLGVNRKEANDCKRVARELLRLPELSLVAEEGLISWGKLREIVRKASPETEEFWLQLAQKYNDQQIQMLVSKTPRGAVPGEVDLEDSAYNSLLRCPLSPQAYRMLEEATRAYSIARGKLVTKAEVIGDALVSLLAKAPLDEKALAKVREEADKDLQAERARQIPLVAEARELAAEIGLIEREQDGELDPDRVEALDGTGCSTCVENGKPVLALDEFESSLGSDVHDPDRVRSFDRKSCSTCIENGERLLTLNESGNSVGSVYLDPDRVDSTEAAPCKGSLLGTKEAGLATGGKDATLSFADSGDLDPGRVNKARAAELLSQALGLANFDTSFLSEMDPDRAQYVRLNNPWSSTRVRFNIDSRHTTKSQKTEILRRDCWCCSTPGCCNKIWLHIHHLESFAEGGKTAPYNLLGLCSACHKNTHDGLLKIERQSDGTLLFLDQYGRRLDRQVDLELAYWLDFEIGWSGGEQDSYKARCGIDWKVFAV